MALAAYTPRLCKFHCFNKNGLFGRDRNKGILFARFFGADQSRMSYAWMHFQSGCIDRLCLLAWFASSRKDTGRSVCYRLRPRYANSHPVPSIDDPGDRDTDVHNVHNVHSIPNRIELQLMIRIPLRVRPYRLKSLCSWTL